MMKRRLLSLALVLAMVLSMLPTVAFATNGTWSGTGSESDPYQIADATDLAALATKVNSDSETYSGEYFILTDDIDLDGSGFSPIGTKGYVDTSTYFAGTFDGDGYTISGLSVSCTNGSGGLFGYVNGGTVKNLSVSGSVHHPYSNNDTYIGGVVGTNAGTVVNCVSSVNVTADVEDGYAILGGIAGKNNGTIENCYVTGTVSATNTAYGTALLGAVTGNGTVTDCYYLDGIVSYDNSATVNTSGTAFTDFGTMEENSSALLTNLNSYVTTNNTAGYLSWEQDDSYPVFKVTDEAKVVADGYSTKYETLTGALTDANDDNESVSITITLLKDVETTATLAISNTMTLDLDGYDITASSAGYSVITVNSSSGNLTLQDTNTANSTSYGAWDADRTSYTIDSTNDTGDDVITGGIIKGGSSASNLGVGGAVTVNGTFTMNSGNIAGNTSNGSGSGGGGGAVNVTNGAFTMSGGTLIGNYAVNNGGAIMNNSGTVTINTGAAITNNAAVKFGGGIYSEQTTNIYGGTISYNTAGSGGGGITVDSNTTTMTAGTISHNTVTAAGSEAYRGGGGVYAHGGIFNLSGGTISCNTNTSSTNVDGDGIMLYGSTFNLSGNPVITNNYATSDSETEDGDGVYLYTGKTITVTGALDSTASIAFTAAATASEDSPVTIAKNATNATYIGSGYTSYFVEATAQAGDVTYVAGTTDTEDEIQLVVAHVHDYTVAVNNGAIVATCDCGETENLTVADDLTYGDEIDSIFDDEDGVFTDYLDGKTIEYVAAEDDTDAKSATYTDATTSMPTDAGTYYARVTVDADTPSYVYYEFTIAPKAITATVGDITTPITKVYDGTTNLPSGTTIPLSTTETLGNGLSLSGTWYFAQSDGTKDSTINATNICGSATVQDSEGAVSNNYTVTLADYTITASITACPITITTKDQTITYGGELVQTEYTYTETDTGEGLVAGHTLSGVVLTTTAVNVDDTDTTISITQSGITIKDSSENDRTSNYNISYANTGEVTINPAVVVNLDLSSDITAPAVGGTPTTTVTDDQYTGTVSWSPDDSAFQGGTAYTATVTLTATANYTFTGVAQNAFSHDSNTVTNSANSGTVTITFPASDLAANTVTFDTPATSFDYGETVSFTATATDGTTPTMYYKVKDAEDDTYTTVVPTDAGEYTVKAVVAEGDNYAAGSATTDFTIDPVEITITLADDGTVTTEPVAAFTVTYYDSEGNEYIELPTDAGDYTVEVTLTNPANYTIDGVVATSNPIEVGTFTITAKSTSSSSTNVGTIVSSGGSSSSTSNDDDDDETTETTETSSGSDDSFFLDVDKDDYSYDAIKWAAENGITTGKSSTMFAPDDINTRAEAVTFIWRAMGSPIVESDTVFEDLDEDAFYYYAVLWAIEEGITIGTSDTTFSPYMECSRAHIITFIGRMAGVDVSDFTNPFHDVDDDDYFYDFVLWAVEHGITTGIDGNSFEPHDDCSREQIVTFLYRYLG